MPTRRQRERRQQRLEAAQRRIRQSEAPRGQAIDGEIVRLQDVPNWRTRPIVQYDRVTTRQQRLNGSLDHAQAETTRKLRALGYRGRIKRIKARECGGIVVADLRNRFLRSRDFDGRTKSETPTKAEFERFKRRFKVTYATIEDPDLPESEARRLQTIRGHVSRGAKPGRPKRRRGKYRRRLSIFEMATIGRLVTKGRSLAQIAAKLNRPRSSIQGWARHFRVLQ
ncbi:MAG TPA: hypothetical protein VGP76_16185 [Planctomycetaceae bacterium]|nr:hypothetical protein [Planctomycetaceae bacterium]